MTRAQLDSLLCDYVDGTLDDAVKTQVEAHLASHPLDRQLVDDAIPARHFLVAAEPVETPPELITQILFEIRHQEQPKPQEQERIWDRFLAWLGPVLQPRFAMGMAMTILSVSMVANLLGIQVRQLTLDDLRPGSVYASVEDRVVRIWDRAEKFYEDLKFVYRMQSFLREWSEQAPTENTTPADTAEGEPRPPASHDQNEQPEGRQRQ